MGRPGLLVVVVSENIISFPTDRDWFADLAEYEKELQRVANLTSYCQYTAETGHYLYLCSGIADNRELPTEVRREACRLLWVYAPVRQVLERNMDVSWFSVDFGAAVASPNDPSWLEARMK